VYPHRLPLYRLKITYCGDDDDEEEEETCGIIMPMYVCILTSRGTAIRCTVPRTSVLSTRRNVTSEKSLSQ
jgi:hypothetical protein